MRCLRAYALVCLLLPVLLMWSSAAGAQRMDAAAVSLPAHPPAVVFALKPAGDASLAASVGSPVLLEPGDPSLLEHLVIGTAIGAVVTLVVGVAGVAMTCESSCEWAGLSVMLSTVIGGGVGFVVGGVVYVVKRTRQ